MPKLSSLTDAYVDDPMGSALPVVNPYFDPKQTKVIIPTGEEKPKVEEPSALSSNIDKILNALFRDDENRLQLWPEKVVREALSGAKKVMSGEIPQWEVDPATGEVHTSPKMVETAQSMAALAGTGGLAGTTEGTLGATPFLRPALKYKDRLYKGKEGQQHLDVIPEALYPEFQKMAMSGEDISHYNFGFVNDRGHFLDREKALQYAIDTGMVDKFAGQYGALTSTLLADSSKPGTAIEAMAKSKFDFAPGESSGSRSVKLGPTEITYGVNPKNNDVELSLIRTDKNKRGEGSARAAAEQFLAEADANGKRVLLNADPMDKSTSKAKLEDFYKSLGFVRNSGRNKDFTTRAEYIRDPILKADSTKPGMAIEAMAKANPFFSAVEHNVAKIPQNKMTGDQWLGTLSNKPGVKPEELDWTGLKSFLEENKGKPVTKAQIEEHLAANKVELKEVRKGGITERDRVVPDQIAQDKYKAEWDAKVAELKPLREKVDDFERKLSPQEWEKAKNDYFFKSQELDAIHDRMVNETVERLGGLNKPTKYHSYQLPGGENYKELLLTLPSKEKTKGWKIRDNPDAEGEFEVLNDKGRVVYGTTDKEDALKYIKDQNGIDARADAYKSSHWDEPNILAHVRMNDRDVGGKKSLHLEEIQSDWHQQGRERGYVDKAELGKAKKSYDQYEADLYKRAKDAFYKDAEETGVSKVNADRIYDKVLKNEPSWAQSRYLGEAEVAKHKQTWDAYQLQKSELSDKLPDAPFKKNWHELALKRMIREAAEKGYDRLSWTPGEAQAARYDLSKQLKELQYLKNEDGTYSIAGIEKNGNGFNHPDNIPANKLPDVVGKEMAEKIIKNEGRRDRGQPSNGGYFSGVDLKIGGEGMKGFYDQIIPKALEQLGKKHGVKAQKGEINTSKPKTLDEISNDLGYGGWHVGLSADQKAKIMKVFDEQKPKRNDASNTVYYIDLPQSLKDQAIGKGFPLFSSSHAGFVFTPVDYEPEFK